MLVSPRTVGNPMNKPTDRDPSAGQLRIGVGFGARRLVSDGAEFAAVVDACEALGFDSLWLGERVTTDMLDPFVGLAVAAGRTKRLRLGASMAVFPGRQPALLAQQLATLDLLSRGRLLPVLGVGSQEIAEQQAFGVRRDERGALLEEGLPLLRRFLAGERVTHRGRFHQFDAVTVGPHPHSVAMDLWMSGTSELALRRAGRLADGWLGSLLSSAETRRARRVVQRAASAAGRCVGPDRFGVMLFLATGEVPAELAAALTRHRPDLPQRMLVADGLDRLAELVAEHAAGGLTRFVVLPAARPADWDSWLSDLAPLAAALQHQPRLAPMFELPRQRPAVAVAAG